MSSNKKDEEDEVDDKSFNISSELRLPGSGVGPSFLDKSQDDLALAWPETKQKKGFDVRGRLNTDGRFERETDAYSEHVVNRRKRNKSWDAGSLQQYRRNYFDLDILTKTSFGFDALHRVHIPDEEDDEEGFSEDELRDEFDLEMFSEPVAEEKVHPPVVRRASSHSSGAGDGVGSPSHRKQPWFRWKLFWAYTGPGWLMSVAYLDPGNIESDLQAGGYAGYQLLWVLSVSTLLGFFLQVLAARLGVATGKNLAENCRDYYGKTDTYFLYLMMQLAIIGSDIQEIVGSAIAFRVLFGFPLWVGCLITGLDTLTFLGLHIIGVRQLELFFVVLIAAMCLCFFATFFSDPSSPEDILEGFFVPYLHDKATVQAVSILGAVVMPHNIYLHSALVLSRDVDRCRESKVAEANKYFAIEAGVALFVSLLINCAVVAVFAHGFFSPTCQDLTESLVLHPANVRVDPPFACVPKAVVHHIDPEVQTTSVQCVTEGGVEGTCMPIGLQGAAHALEQFLGKGASVMWAIGLLAAGQSSTMTGTYAGQFVMEGFLQLEIPNWVRVAMTRAISLIPATLVAVLANSDYLAADRLDETLNVLQSLQLPFALLPLLGFTGSTEFMGSFANGPIMRSIGWASSVVVIAINVYLVTNTVDFAAMTAFELMLAAIVAVFYTWFVIRLGLDAWRNSSATTVYTKVPVSPHANGTNHSDGKQMFQTVDNIPVLLEKHSLLSSSSPDSASGFSYGSLD